MITHQDFATIDNEVQEALREAFDFVKRRSMDFVLFLANGELRPDIAGGQLNLNPYTIDNREDRYKDKDRNDFLVEFMRTFYSFPAKAPLEDVIQRLHMELMIYTHIWESKPFLRQLYRLTALAQGKLYPWSVNVPDMSKHDYIRNDIRKPLKAFGLKLSNVITSGFHTTIRNAFAHSEYYFNEHTKEIILDSYTGKAWDMHTISFDDWSKRFAYSVLLSYHFHNIVYQYRAALPAELNTTRFVIAHPLNDRTTRARFIEYDVNANSFHFSNLQR
jgi:hypothetical protein